MRERGVAVTLVTGRMFAASRRWAARLGIGGPIVCYQGAAIYAAATGERLMHSPLEAETGRRVFAKVAADRLGALGYLDDRLYAQSETPLLRKYQALSQVSARIVPSLEELFANQPSTKIVALVPRELAESYVQELAAFVGDGGYVTRSLAEYIEVLNPRVNKGTALEQVARMYGMTLEETLAIGDSWNDEPLLRAAGIGVAMGGAPHELLALADAVVADVAGDGVAEALERFVLAPVEEAAG